LVDNAILGNSKYTFQTGELVCILPLQLLPGATKSLYLMYVTLTCLGQKEITCFD